MGKRILSLVKTANCGQLRYQYLTYSRNFSVMLV